MHKKACLLRFCDAIYPFWEYTYASRLISQYLFHTCAKMRMDKKSSWGDGVTSSAGVRLDTGSSSSESSATSGATVDFCVTCREFRYVASNGGLSAPRKICSRRLRVGAKFEFGAFGRKLRLSWTFAITSGTILLFLPGCLFQYVV